MYTTVYTKSYIRVVYTQIIYKCLIYGKCNAYYSVCQIIYKCLKA